MLAMQSAEARYNTQSKRKYIEPMKQAANIQLTL